MSFLYPRTVSVSRPKAQTGVGQAAYGGTTESAETAVAGAQNLPANIQLAKEGRKPTADLPGDVSKTTFWKVFIPLAAVANGVIKERDVVTDDLGLRYIVTAPYWNSLGYNLFCERAET